MKPFAENDDSTPSDSHEVELLAKHERLTQTMRAVLSGEVARGRDRKYWENLQLKPQHMQMLIMKAAGFTNNYIAEALDYTPARVSVILNHPDAQVALAALVSYQAEELLDVRARIKAHAGEALNVKLDLMRNSKSDAVRNVAAGDILAAAGYGAVNKSVNLNANVQARLEPEEAADLKSALRESMEVDAEYFSQGPPVSGTNRKAIPAGQEVSVPSEVQVPAPTEKEVAA